MSGGEATNDDETTDNERAPDPDDPRKPDSPNDLTKPSVFYVLRKTASNPTSYMLVAAPRHGDGCRLAALLLV